MSGDGAAPSARLGIVLAGGASRGAYEAGVLRYLFCELPKQLGTTPWPSIVSGTSVGALNGAFVAARDPEGLRWLSETWRNLEIPQVYGLSYGDLFRTVRDAFRDNTFALADPAPLQRMIVDRFPAAALARAIDLHDVSWIVNATELATGISVQFVDSKVHVDWETRPGTRTVRTRIGPKHTMASAALPVLFPPIEIRRRQFVDGGLRMNTPLDPVLRCGADRVIVISLKRQTQDVQRSEHGANLPFLVGKTLNALLLDPVEQDLHDARERNRLISWGTERFGSEFATRLADDLGLRKVTTLFMTPSEDLGAMAADVFKAQPPNVSGALRKVLRWAAERDGAPDADLLSYLYFDKAYTGALERLGFEDAKRHEEALARLVAPELTARS